MFFRFQTSTQIASLLTDAVQVITGKVVAPREVKIPGTEIQCACYWMMTESWQQPARQKGRKMWMPVGTQLGTNGFFVEDESGKVWVPDTADALEIRNGWENGGLLGKKGKQRYVSRSIKSGDVVKIRGTITKSRGAEPGDCLVLRPDVKGIISIIQKKKVRK